MTKKKPPKPKAAAGPHVGGSATSGSRRNPWAGLESDTRAHVSSLPDFQAPGAVEADAGLKRKAEEVAEAELAGEGTGKRRYVNNTISPSERMRQFLHQWARPAKAAYMRREAGPIFPTKCHSCSAVFSGNTTEIMYRCFDCLNAPIECGECTISSHVRTPFHRVDVWAPDLGFWDRKSLAAVKSPTGARLTIELGHPFVHDHGIHEYPVRFCPCLDPETDEPVPEPIQLIHFGLWPGTWKRPESAYTISGLRDHQLLGLQAQMSTHDYFEYLRRTTDMVCPEDVPDRYRELMTAAREFMFTRATKRADVEPTQELEPGVLAIRCPACPQPGINMDPKYEKTGRPEGDEYLDGLHYTIDGNFQQTQKNKPMDEADEPLTLGAAYHADERDFKEFQRTRPKEKKEPTT